jgi:3,4-dihydroxy 2-butanone 4-phosphate synthase
VGLTIQMLASRYGHTELSLALAEAADQPPATVVCEMLDDDTGTALSRADAKQYAQETGIWYVEGRDVTSVLR